MALIGISGRASAGKDTIGERLSSRHGFARIAFATPLKDALIGALASLGVTREVLNGPEKDAPLPGLDISPRRLLQTIGDDWGRQRVRQDLWILVAAKRIKAMRATGLDVVVTDVRYENEAWWVRSEGGTIWHVRRPHAGNVVALHASEAGIAIKPGIDSVIDNDRGLDQLWDRVRDALAGECVA